MPVSLKETFESLYAQQTKDDGALDLFEPSVELLLAPFYATVRPRLNPISERDVFPDKFAEYFGIGFADAILREGRAEATDPELAPLLLRNDCGALLETWSIPRPCLQVKGKRGTYKIQFNQLFAGDLLWLYFHERMGVHAARRFRQPRPLPASAARRGRFGAGGHGARSEGGPVVHLQ